MILEACVNSAFSAIEAQIGGADRVELCGNMSEGGCTPSTGTIIVARKNLQIDLFVMIRPRGADFCYEEDEFDVMKEDVLTARKLGANGVVFGILRPDGSIDKERMSKLSDLARPMSVTCHRAFDMTREPFNALDDLISIGIDRILTSGQNDNALEGAPLIRKLIERANDRITLMPGHGIKENNLAQVISATGAHEFHVYLTRTVATKMKFVRSNVSMGKPDLSEDKYTVVDSKRISEAKKTVSLISNFLSKHA